MKSECRFTKDHEWAKPEGALIVVGITDYAQDQLGDVVFLELPEVGKTVAKGESMAVVESVKAASDIYAPLSGTVVERNEAAVASPELINQDPFGKAWLVKISPAQGSDFNEMLSAEEYDRLIEDLKR